MPLPDSESREALINNLLLKHQQSSGSRRSTMLPDKAIKKIVRVTEGYSGSDLTAVMIIIYLLLRRNQSN